MWPMANAYRPVNQTVEINLVSIGRVRFSHFYRDQYGPQLAPSQHVFPARFPLEACGFELVVVQEAPRKACRLIGWQAWKVSGNDRSNKLLDRIKPDAFLLKAEAFA